MLRRAGLEKGYLLMLFAMIREYGKFSCCYLQWFVALLQFIRDIYNGFEEHIHFVLLFTAIGEPMFHFGLKIRWFRNMFLGNLMKTIENTVILWYSAHLEQL